MLGRRRLQRKLLRWTLVLIALGTVYVAAIDNRLYPKEKAKANQIASPWDSSNAPKPFANKKTIRIKPLLYKPSVALQDQGNKRGYSKHKRHRNLRSRDERASLP